MRQVYLISALIFLTSLAQAGELKAPVIEGATNIICEGDGTFFDYTKKTNSKFIEAERVKIRLNLQLSTAYQSAYLSPTAYSNSQLQVELKNYGSALENINNKELAGAPKSQSVFTTTTNTVVNAVLSGTQDILLHGDGIQTGYLSLPVAVTAGGKNLSLKIRRADSAFDLIVKFSKCKGVNTQ